MLALPLLTAGVLSITSMARAEIPVPLHQPSAPAVKTAAGEGKARFDWLAKRKTVGGSVQHVVQKVSLGNGGWICSPAGFKQKSRCFKR